MSLGRNTSIYSIELVNPSGTVLAELSGRASQRSFTRTRNAADDIEWYLDIDELEDFCRRMNQDPKQLFITNYTEVRVKRLGTVLAAGQGTYKYGSLTTGGANLLQVKAAGFLNLLTQRYTTLGTTQIYSGMDASAIAWDLINKSQQGLNDPTGIVDPTTGLIIPGTATSGIQTTDWDFGITQGSLATVGNHDRQYSDMLVSDALIDFCNTSSGGFDMEITYDKKFNTYTQLGIQRPDILLEYPGIILQGDMTEDGTQIGNFITAQGTGNGSDTQASYSAASAGSTATYKVRQMIVSPSSLDVADNSLQSYSSWNLAQYQVPLVLPQITYNPAHGPAPTDYNVGDWVHIKIRNHPLYNDVDGMYRVEQLRVVVDDDDQEQVTVTTSTA